MKKVVLCGSSIGASSTMLAAMINAIDQSVIISQNIADVPCEIKLRNMNIYDDELYNYIHEEVKGIPPNGRSQKQHNSIMGLNKKKRF